MKTLLLVVLFVALPAFAGEAPIKPTKDELKLLAQIRKDCKGGCAILNAEQQAQLVALLMVCGGESTPRTEYK